MNNLEKIAKIKIEIQVNTEKIQQFDQLKSELVTSIIRSQGKLELLDQLEKEKTGSVQPTAPAIPAVPVVKK